MSRRDRLRRVVILCRAFAWNLAYYRVGRQKEYAHVFDDASAAEANFWRATNSNNIDMCVLEWCKLFADPKGKHYWGRIVSDRVQFKEDLLNHLVISEAAFEQESRTMREYRDKFLAHLDSDNTMNIPRLDLPKKAVWFYHIHVLKHEAQRADLDGIDGDVETAYRQFEREAKAVYQKAASRLV